MPDNESGRTPVSSSKSEARLGAGLEIAVFLTPAEVRNNVARVGKTTLYQWVRAGIFPAPYKLGPSRIGFKKCEVDDWIASRPRISRLVDAKQ